jgi:tyrosyl-tRNA synthetase
MGKTEKGNVWLDPNKTSYYEFYQFWLRSSDEDAEKWIRIFTFLSLEQIETIINEHEKNREQHLLQRRLAEEVTVFVHGKEAFQKAIGTSKILHQKDDSAETLTISDLEGIEGIVRSDFFKHKIVGEIDVVSFLAETNIFSSKGEARKMIQNGGVSINRKKVDNIQMPINASLLLHDKYILVQKGRKNYYLVTII